MLEVHSGHIHNIITEGHPRQHTWNVGWQLDALKRKAWRNVQMNNASVCLRRANKS